MTVPLNFRLRCAALIAVPLVLLTAAASADPPDARGIYFHIIEGSFSGTEWLIVLPESDFPDRYEFRDDQGLGANGLVHADETITVYGAGTGSGQFFDSDHFELDWFFPPQSFHSQMNRAPMTTVDFPLEMESSEIGPTELSGDWNVTKRTYDAQTGESLLTTMHTATTQVLGATMGVILDDGTMYRFVFESPDELLCRFTLPVPTVPRYRTIPGSSTNDDRNVIGHAAVAADQQSMQLRLMLQTRAAVGLQEQFIEHFELTRPDCIGDFDASGDVGFADLTTLLALWGEPEGDLDGDGVAGFGDLVLLLGYWGPCPV